jgi:hypothetical protein
MAAWGVIAVAGLAGLGVPGQGVAQTGASSAPTFAADVAPLMQVKCMECHYAGGIGPMSLTTYEEVRPWAAMIREKVSSREMPPWHVDKNLGIQEFKNDISLSDDEINTIVSWIDAGAPLGDPADLPPPLVLPAEGEWRLESILGRGPDLVVKTTPFTIPAFGPDQWWQPVIPLEGLTGSRYIMANETRPSKAGRPGTHHANTSIVRDGSSRLAGDEGNGFSNFGIGKPFDIYPPNTGMRVQEGDQISFNIHYYPTGTEIPNDQLEVGVWLYPEGEVPMIETAGDESFSAYRSDDQEMLIPPNSRQMTQGFTVLQTAARIHSFRVHQHIIGTGQSLEAIYPDGRVEILGKAGWHPNWHITYLYEDHVAPLLPKGTVLVVSAWYDNTANNPWNPDSNVWRVHGRRTGDEMSHMWVGISYLDEEEYAYLVAERERVLAEMGIETAAAQ